MATFLKASAKAALVFCGYLGIHYACAWFLPLPSAGYTICANLLAVAATVLIGGIVGVSGTQIAGLRPMPRWQFWMAAIGTGIGVCLLVRWWMLVVPAPSGWVEQYAERVNLVQQSPTWIRRISSVVVAPFAEEWIFRGLIYRSLKRGMPCFVAVLVSSALFAALHGTIVWMLYTFLLGLVLCTLYEGTRSLWSCIVCHAAFNIVGQIGLFGVVPDALAALIVLLSAVILVFSLWYIKAVAQE